MRQSPPVQLIVHADASLARVVRAGAKREGRSVSNYIRHLLASALPHEGWLPDGSPAQTLPQGPAQ